ncbi:ABC transporter permease [Clostridium oryzae]|uniref:L-arabinose transporter permease protein n=1 Tax=Clostridium oryzae TaxID=1450648 RepID=A0A1V4IJM5_9CLOT|nr:ABC transporter permease [Clostridium oryzae]OPJ60212.1 L-arabinose transporter permease protein [Clostridium oryzae]
MNKESKFEIIRTLISVGIALIIAFIVILLVSKEPAEALKAFLLGPLTSKSHMGNVIELSIPLMFAGLSMALLFKTRLFNMGAEGIFYFSGIIAAIIAIYWKTNSIIHPLFAIAAGTLAGGLISAIPGILKAKWNASELVTSLMFNNILLGVGLYILTYQLRDPNALSNCSVEFKDTARLVRIIPGTRVHVGFIIVLIMVLLTHYFLYKTKWGYELRMTGINRKFAEYSGIKTAKVIVYVHVLAGLIAGMGGSVEVLGMHHRFEWITLPGYGFDGALIAMLAKNNPVSVIGSAIFIAYIRTGADLMSRTSDVPAEMISIIQAIIILLISAEKFLKYWKEKSLLKEAKKNA